MLNALIPRLLKLRTAFPGVYAVLVSLGKRYLGKRLGIYPRLLGNEIGAVTEVLRGSQWNMAYGKGLVHERLEAAFADYIGTANAIAVNTGGMALQMLLRALGLKPGNEVIHQVDTCAATAMAVMNAGCTPVFADISQETFMLSPDSVEKLVTPQTRALVATHMWGNPEDIVALRQIAKRHGLFLLEDACLSLGAICQERMAGSFGDAGVFSFGCVKPIQGGEGGMIVTNDGALARELRSMRHWGDRTIEYGIRDAGQLAWNGRMSEIVAAVVNEQLKGYPHHLAAVRNAVEQFRAFLNKIQGLELVLGAAASARNPSYSQVVLRIDETALGWKKNALKDALHARGVPVWHANFELINSLSFFRGNRWEDWLLRGNIEQVRKNYGDRFPVAQRIFDSGGLGLAKMNFLSQQNLHYLMRQIEALAATRNHA